MRGVEGLVSMPVMIRLVVSDRASRASYYDYLLLAAIVHADMHPGHALQ